MTTIQERIQEKERATRVAREQLAFARQYIIHLRRVDRTGRMVVAVNDFTRMMDNNESFTPNQLSYIDDIYEAVCKGLGMPSVSKHVDAKRKGLRYG